VLIALAGAGVQHERFDGVRFMRLVVLIVLATFVAAASVAAQDAAAASEGKKIYGAKDCAKCHMIAGKGNKIGKLDGIASKIDGAEMRKWLTQPAEMEKTLEKAPKVKMSSKIKLMNLRPADIDSLVAYLGTLK
jgi:mono/diheme cytochrome c family protein